MKPPIVQVTELPLASWLEQFRNNLEGTGFYIRVDEESLLRDPPIKAFGDESPRIRIRPLPGASIHGVMMEVLAVMDLTYVVNEDHLEVFKKADAGKRPDREPLYCPGSPASESYKKTVARLKAEMKPGIEQRTEVPLSSWLSVFQRRLDGTGFSIRVNEASLNRSPAVKASGDGSPRIRIQALPGATLESVMTEVLWKQGLIFSVNENHIEILNRVDADQKRPKREYGGIALERTSPVGIFEKEYPHPWGLCDMHGNVWQWCENWHDGEQKLRSLRGGSWNGSPADCRTAHRFGAAPDRRSNYRGFRVCFRPE